jgi:arylsulfatase
VLPIPDRKPVSLTTYDAKDPDTKFPPIRPLRPPAGAPNVLIILLDDVGFGASSAFGGPCRTPTAERLAAAGLKYTRFHTTALCSPTRAALLTGRNHHAVGMGAITEVATAAPGYNSLRPNTCAPLAEVLKLNGYSTAQFGKCHEVPVFEATPIGPFDRWPIGSGFEHFYGFIGGETNQYYPGLFEGTTPIEPEKTPEEGYHLMEDLADRTIAWIRQQKAMAPDKPFFVYFAPGATHAPHHVPKDWIAKYKGKFDQGWDALREETFARQKTLGVIPPQCELTTRPAEIPAWEDTDPRLRPVLAREMEIYAAFLEYADHHIGRVIDKVAELGVLDDTFVYYIVGDNGASAEGSLIGTINEIAMGDAPDLVTPELMMARIDDLGSHRALNHYAVGWAHAMDTPYQWTKQVASHFGGTRNGTIVHWPNGFKAKGEIRSQFHHVIDVAPTVLEAAGLPHPTLDAPPAGERGDQYQEQVAFGHRRDRGAGVRRERSHRRAGRQHGRLELLRARRQAEVLLQRRRFESPSSPMRPSRSPTYPRCPIPRSLARPATVTGQTCWRRSMPTSVRWSMPSIAWASATTPS